VSNTTFAPATAIMRGQTIVPPTSEVVAVPFDSEDLNQRGVYSFNSRDKKSRAFNLLRSQVLKLMAARNWSVIGITSATPSVGKSFVAANLAAAIARTPDTDVCLFDLDLRRSSVAEIFGLEGEVGLNHYLGGSVPDLASIGRRIGDERLYVFPSYIEQIDSAELLAGEPAKRLFDVMGKLPGKPVVICDLPPVFANDDTIIAMEHMDAFLLVLEDGVSTKKQLQDAMRLLAPAPCIGTVLNRYRGGFGNEDYGYGYGRKDNYGKYYS
jgi:protein-tyrosine kinase